LKYAKIAENLQNHQNTKITENLQNHQNTKITENLQNSQKFAKTAEISKNNLNCMKYANSKKIAVIAENLQITEICQNYNMQILSKIT